MACHSDEKKSIGQALATVNGVDITVHQVNAELRAVPGNGGPARVQQRALEQVIDRELLAGQAVHDKLDRDPAVLMALARSRAQILSQAWLQGRIGSAAKPASTEIDSYTQSHPELFANRKLYSLRYLTMPATAVDSDVTTLVDQAQSLDELGSLLRSRKIAFVQSQSLRTSADLPPQLLANLAMVAQRPVFVMRDGEQALLASLVFIKDDPVTGVAAAQQAEQFLANRSAMARVQQEVARLRQGAQISYAPGSAPALPQPGGTPARPAAATENGIAGLH